MNSINENELDKLIKRRLTVMLVLIVIVTFSYGALVIGMSFFPDLLSQAVKQGSLITYGFVILVLIVICSIATSSFYIWWMEKKFDPSMRAITSNHR